MFRHAIGIASLSLALFACSKTTESSTASTETKVGTYAFIKGCKAADGKDIAVDLKGELTTEDGKVKGFRASELILKRGDLAAASLKIEEARADADMQIRIVNGQETYDLETIHTLVVDKNGVYSLVVSHYALDAASAMLTFDSGERVICDASTMSNLANLFPAL